MAKTDYSRDELFQIGKTCYDKLALHCQTLEITGFWEQAEKVMKQKSSEVLDLYVQTVLMELAMEFDEIIESQVSFIQTVTCTNPLGISGGLEIDESFVNDVDRVYKMPPVLIQLSSLYDKEKQDDMTQYFIDAMLNLLLCMAYLNTSVNSEKINDFLQEYYDKVSYYISGKTDKEHVYYLAHKLGNEKILCDIDQIKEEIVRQKEYEAEQKKRGTSIPKDTSAPKYALNIEWIEPEQPAEVDASGNAMLIAPKVPDEEALKRMREKHRMVLEEQKRHRAEREKQREENRRIREQERERKRKEEEEQAKEMFLEVKKRIEEREAIEAQIKAEEEARIQALVDELNGLIGLSSVKEEIRSLINLIKIRKLRDQMNMPSVEMSYHMVFTGSPGTGKTTVARLVAKIYKELGILTEGNLVETDRSGLVAGYVGQTAIKVHEIVDQAIGGILFIDEAYSLANPDVPNDFGTEAVDTLVKLMEDHRDNLVVIVAGYTEEMKKFLKSNTGLISRFNKFINFPDYSKEELVEIMCSMISDAGLEIDEEAKAAVLTMLDGKTEEEWEAFGNARGIRNLFEKIVMNQANRLVMLENPSKEDLTSIHVEDVIV